MGKYALIIAAEQYQSSRFSSLKKARADAESMHVLLRDQAGFEADNIQLLIDQQWHQVKVTVTKFFKNRKRDDLLVLYFSGHGERPESDELCLILSDTDPDAIADSSIDCSRLKKSMNQSRSKRQLLLLDCCYSGAIASVKSANEISNRDFATAHSDAFDRQKGEGRFIIAATEATNVAREVMDGVADRKNALFTHAIVDAVTSGKAMNDEGDITVQSLYQCIRQQVVEDSNHQQIPKLINPTGDGDLLIAASPHKPLPMAIRKDLSSDDPDKRLVVITKIKQLIRDDCYKENGIKALEGLCDDRDRYVHDEAREVLQGLQNNFATSEKLINKDKPSEQDEIPKPEIKTKKRSGQIIIFWLLLVSLFLVYQFFIKNKSENLLNGNSEREKVNDVFKDKLKIGGDGPKMIVIPAGSFRMGDLTGNGADDEKPVHDVIIKKPFSMSITEITFTNYDRFAIATKREKPNDSGWGRGDRPVINVSWHDAKAYAKWLSEQTGKSYRLPTEAEWEYAARAGTETDYFWGNDINCLKAQYDGGKNSDCYYKKTDSSYRGTATVGSFAANKFGLYDMHGNVWEWVEDCWNKLYTGAPKNGNAWMKGDCEIAVVRGGSWDGESGFMRSSNRAWSDRSFRDDDNGFRLVQD